jgi:hypothetical protein
LNRRLCGSKILKPRVDKAWMAYGLVDVVQQRRLSAAEFFVPVDVYIPPLLSIVIDIIPFLLNEKSCRNQLGGYRPLQWVSRGGATLEHFVDGYRKAGLPEWRAGVMALSSSIWFEMSIKAYISVTRNGAFAPFVRPTPQSDPWRHDRARIVS